MDSSANMKTDGLFMRQMRAMLSILALIPVLLTIALVVGIAGAPDDGARGAHASAPLAGSTGFPPIDRTKLRISLGRTGCYGSCPAYLVSIDGAGNVLWTTRENGAREGIDERYASPWQGVVIPGTFRTRVPVGEVDHLVDQFRQARFFRLRDEYVSQITDHPTFVLTIDTGNGVKHVLDYAGSSAGMPPVVTRLQDEVDRIAGSRMWIEGTNDAVSLLVQRGARFDGNVGRRLAFAAAERNDVAMLQRLQRLGVRFDHPSADRESISALGGAARRGSMAAFRWLLENTHPPRPVRLAALMDASESGKGEVVDLLLQRDPISSMPQVTRDRLVREFANTLMPNHLRTALAAGGNPNGYVTDGPLVAPGLMMANQLYVPADSAELIRRRREVVQILLDAGARADLVDPMFQESVLFRVGDPVVATMLLDAGADPNFVAKDEFGEPIIFSIHDEDVALTLLNRGHRSDAIRPQDGMTLRKWAWRNGWYRVLAWLEFPILRRLI